MIGSVTPREPGLGTRLAASALIAGGLLFALYQAIRPFRDNAATMASDAWLISHLCAIGGFTLVALGLAAVPYGGRLGGAAVAATWLGAGLALPYYGAETFGLWVIARRSLATGDAGLLRLVDDFHSAPVPMITFAIGLLLMGAGAVTAAVALARSGVVAWHHGLGLAVAYVLLIPQFFTPQPVRIVHGLLVLAGALWLAVGLLRGPRRAVITAAGSSSRRE